MATRILGPDDVDVYRTIRLDALRTDPSAFCSTAEREAAFDDETFRARITSFDGRPGAVIVDDGRVATGGAASAAVPAGTVGVGETGEGSAMLVGMWVRPEARRDGVARRLVDAAVAWAMGRGLDAVVLWVVADNAAAIACYGRCGFVATGAVDTVPGRPDETEIEMRRTLR